MQLRTDYHRRRSGILVPDRCGDVVPGRGPRSRAPGAYRAPHRWPRVKRHAAYTLGQAPSTSSSSNTCAFGSNVQAGTLLLAMGSAQPFTGSPTIGCSDTRANSWTPWGAIVNGQSLGVPAMRGYYAISNGAGASTVTMTPNSGTTEFIILMEFVGPAASPLDGFDKTADAGDSSSPITASVTAAEASELGVSFSFCGNASAWTAGTSGYTSTLNVGANGSYMYEYNLDIGASGGKTIGGSASLTLGVNGWVVAATFKLMNSMRGQACL